MSVLSDFKWIEIQSSTEQNSVVKSESSAEENQEVKVQIRTHIHQILNDSGRVWFESLVHLNVHVESHKLMEVNSFIFGRTANQSAPCNPLCLLSWFGAAAVLVWSQALKCNAVWGASSSAGPPRRNTRVDKRKSWSESTAARCVAAGERLRENWETSEKKTSRTEEMREREKWRRRRCEDFFFL